MEKLHESSNFVRKRKNMSYTKRKKKKLALIKLYNRVSDASGVHRRTTAAVLDALWVNLREFITEGYELEVPDFGTFCQRIRSERTNYDVNHPGRVIYNPPSTLIHFDPVKEWKNEHYISNALIDLDAIPKGSRLSGRLRGRIAREFGPEVEKRMFSANQ